jgi:hypothetical protein
MNSLEWSNECRFIADATDRILTGNVDAAFNGDIEFFRQYCAIQMHRATVEGFDDSAQYIQHCIDDLPESTL